MDPNTARMEAERWLGIAAKLLTARDFLGSKTFAIRARDSDPNNQVSDQILAVVETVLAGEKRVNTSQHPDWYTILQLPRLVRDPDLISNHYRRLVSLLNPDRNRLPFADYALQLVMDAWSVLSDPNKKWVFDNDLALFLQRGGAPDAPPHLHLNQQPQPQVQPQINTFQFFQPQPQQQQQQQPVAEMWQHQQQQQESSYQSQQLHQIEFMQPQQQQQQQQQQIEFMQHQQQHSQPPLQQQQQQHQLPPQWQIRDPTPPRGGVVNVTVAASGSSAMPIFRGVPDVGPVTAVPTPALRPIPAPPAPAPAPAPQRPVVFPSRVIDGNVGNVGNVASDNNVFNSGIDNVSANVNASVGGVVNEDENENENENENDNGNDNDGVRSSVVDDGVAVNESNDVRVGEGDGEGEGEGESFWTSCPYCLYLYEYQKVYKECTLRCQNCRRGFHAIQVPKPPSSGDDKDIKSSFGCWGFFPLGFSTATWKKNNRVGKSNVASSWVPFSPMFACPGENGGEKFQWFDSNGSASVGPKNIGQVPASRPRVYRDYIDEDNFVSDPSDSDSSDKDWRRKPTLEKKRKKKRGNVGRPRKVRSHGVVVQNQPTPSPGIRGGVSEGTERGDIVIGLTANSQVDSRKKVGATLTRNQAKRRAKNMGKLDLNVEFNNEGNEHAPTASAVNGEGEEDAIENIGFFEGLDEFFSTMPILNVGGEEKAKPS